ncbi:ATP-binding protein [Malacoplasma muris]|uniref:ATP-binding protein n=1 Tax=Malacoplasma muris TaxID=2119 RepID=UPI00398E819F
MENKKDFVETIDITPSTSIYNIFAKLPYNHSTALSEFIDNSTQSFEDNNIFNENIRKQIYIFYYADKGDEKLVIIDNAFGIPNNNIERVLKLNIPAQKKNSRNEFGMGLKTAAFWYGKKIVINTKFVGENSATNIKMNLDDLQNYKNNNIQPKYFDKEIFQKHFYNFLYGTVIQISDLYKKITDKTLIKITKILSSKFRKDISEKNVEIRIIKVKNKELYDATRMENDSKEFAKINKEYEAQTLIYQEPKIRINEYTGKEYKIYIDDYVLFDDFRYRVYGWIGLLEKGGRDIGGLVLLRRGRTILGDEDNNKYKPRSIFKDAGSFEYQRIYGTLNLDEFPVTQQKDNFDWGNGLDEEFEQFLLEKIKNMKFEGKDLFVLARQKINPESKIEKKDIINKKTAQELQESINVTEAINGFEMNLTQTNDMFVAQFEDDVGDKVKMLIDVVKENEQVKKWLEIDKSNNPDYEYKITLNLNTPFFAPFNNDVNHVKNQMIKFCIYYVYAEIQHTPICSSSQHIRHLLNEMFSKKVK